MTEKTSLRSEVSEGSGGWELTATFFAIKLIKKRFRYNETVKDYFYRVFFN